MMYVPLVRNLGKSYVTVFKFARMTCRQEIHLVLLVGDREYDDMWMCSNMSHFTSLDCLCNLVESDFEIVTGNVRPLSSDEQGKS